MSFTKPTASGRDYPTQVGRLVDIVEGPALRNFVRNGDFQIAQRGTSFAGITSEQYTLDGWRAGAFGTSTVTQESFTVGQTDVPDNPRKFLRLVRSVAAVTSNVVLTQYIEFPERLSGKAVTVSFRARVSSGTKALVFDFSSSGVTPAVDTSDNAFTATTTWTLFFANVTLPAMTAATGAAYLAFRIQEGSGLSTFTLDIADVQIEEGSEATRFERLNVEQQLRWCQRFYQRIEGAADIAHFCAGAYYTTTLVLCGYQFVVPMRVAPTLSYSAAADLTVEVAGASRASSAVAITRANTRDTRIDITTAADTAGRAGVVQVNANKWLAFSAEL